MRTYTLTVWDDGETIHLKTQIEPEYCVGLPLYRRRDSGTRIRRDAPIHRGVVFR